VIKNFNELIEKTRSETIKKTVAVVAAHDLHSLEAVDIAYKNNIVAPVLIGDGAQIRELIKANGFGFSDAPIIEEKDDIEAAKKAVAMIREGKADFLMKGKLQTADLLKEVVNKERGLHKGRVMSHFGIFEIQGYHKLLVLTDGGMLPHPDVNEKAQILMNAVDTLHDLGYVCPKVAALAATEVVNPKMPETVEAYELEQMNARGEIKNCIVNGPISYDCAVNKEVSDLKGYKGAVAGDADVLIAPNIHAGNIMGKMFMYTCGAKMAGIIVGAACPIVLTSRGSSAEEKLYSIMLSAAVSNRNN